MRLEEEEANSLGHRATPQTTGKARAADSLSPESIPDLPSLQRVALSKFFKFL